LPPKQFRDLFQAGALRLEHLERLARMANSGADLARQFLHDQGAIVFLGSGWLRK
jgi:hypothetical protein